MTTVVAESEHERRLKSKLRRELGSDLLTLLNDPQVEDIARNSDGLVWVKRQSAPWEQTFTLTDVRAENILRAIATSRNLVITPESPSLDASLILDGSRVHGNIPPSTKAPCFTIRKFPSTVFPLDEYVKQGALSKKQYAIIQSVIKEKRNILIVGNTGSGKTTLTNAILDEIVKVHPEDRIFIAEDTPEIRCNAQNVEYLYTTHNRTLHDNLRDGMRMRPDRLLVGEIRGVEALFLLEAWNTGHNGGLATAHSDAATPHSALSRVEMLVARAGGNLSNNFIRRLIGSTVNVIICIKNTNKGRRIESITTVKGYMEDDYILESNE